ncbi:MAG: hybrid sensor histidine kinase/response regulator [Anaerolineae bacterium]|nr:hybrid sensor histidine kinase/response regulator [Anaerolineae bacterium]
MSSMRKAASHPELTSPSRLPDAALLIAHSDYTVVRALQWRLQAAGYSVLCAATEDEMLEQVHERRPDVLILDTQLPGLRSCRACRLFKTDESLAFMPVIALIDEESGCFANEANCYADVVLFNPVDSDELLTWLPCLLRTRCQMDRLKRENRQLRTISREVDVLKSDIIRNVSHEFRTPLVQIKAAVSLLVEDVSKHGTRGQRQVANMAAQAVARFESVVDNIRQLAQTHNITLGPVSVLEAIDLAIRHMERSWASREARQRVEKVLDGDLPPVLGDKRAMAHLLQLLLDNALKFSPEDMPVQLLAFRTAVDRVWIGVQDYGIGIAVNEQQRIFEPFYQVDASHTRRYGGTGSGLALALLLANGLRTVIQVESEPGEGSVFSFELPVVDLDDFGMV